MSIELILVSPVVVSMLLPAAVVASMGEAVAWAAETLSIFVLALFVTTPQFTTLASSEASVLGAVTTVMAAMAKVTATSAVAAL
jgi:hypothetical protein